MSKEVEQYPNMGNRGKVGAHAIVAECNNNEVVLSTDNKDDPSIR